MNASHQNFPSSNRSLRWGDMIYMYYARLIIAI